MTTANVLYLHTRVESHPPEGCMLGDGPETDGQWASCMDSAIYVKEPLPATEGVVPVTVHAIYSRTKGDAVELLVPKDRDSHRAIFNNHVTQLGLAVDIPGLEVEGHTKCVLASVRPPPTALLGDVTVEDLERIKFRPVAPAVLGGGVVQAVVIAIPPHLELGAWASERFEWIPLDEYLGHLGSEHEVRHTQVALG